ncbi:hypothetical protein CEUSTIGMA_g1450.t1 [Chlamydomonas eustigma]|uniref:B30.2/SPRY domain-containing protein n=1 Tax=Chlamydomonas eustigma TaxID=1157962 RepID=A0A250WTW9_9CHLO|nr:hypothetical protein CEUSTIGMA_g1450.t1 [Chlamydomonas eustigma]|eukprot:GAX74000.1 hypothetical protein CEUSTIGMA_g1450.t1 [Chlamydomonas eustigma]
MTDISSKDDRAEQAKDLAGRSKKQVRKRGSRNASNQQELTINKSQVDLVRLIRAEPKKADENPGHIVMSKVSKASQLVLSEDCLSVTGHKGFRTACATHGVPGLGTYFCEVKMCSLGASGHVRVGFCTKKAELQAPVGFDGFGYAFRDVDGSRVHQGRREAYGTQFKEGDVVGMLIHLPEGGRPIEARERKVVRYKGSLFYEEEPEPTPVPLPGSFIKFFVNGVDQGQAYFDILEGTYYPAISIFTLPEQREGATVSVNFGPSFTYGLPPQETGVKPFSSLTDAISIIE